MRSIPLPIVGGSKFARYPKISDETTYNMIVSDTTENAGLIPYSGYRQVIRINDTDVGRDLFTSVSYGHMFAVISNSVYIIGSDNSYSFIGRLRTSNGAVSIAENDSHQVAFADGEKIYIYNTITQTPIVEIEVDFAPGYISFMDGYFIAADSSSNQWRLSALNDGTNWPSDSQHIGLLQTQPDLTQATVCFNRQVFVMGKTVTELWYDVGNTLFPFQRNNYLSINYGVVNVETIDSEFNMLVWLGASSEGNLVILASGGGEPEIISTDGIEYLLSTLKHPEICSAFLYQDNGHIFYQITWERDDISLVYDFKTQLFSNVTNTNSGHHIARRAVFFQGANYFVSFVDGNIYAFGSKYTTYDGLAIPRTRVIPSFRLPGNSRFIANKLELIIEQGYSKYLTNIDVSLSKDGGVTFGNSIRIPFNSLGNRTNICRVFGGLGIANELSIQIRFWGGDNGNNGRALQPEPEFSGNNPILNSSQRFVVLGATLDYYQ